MVSEHTIAQLGARIAEEFRPDRVVVFGSYAYGTPTVDSDVDLLVVMPYEGTQLGQAVAIAQRCKTPFSLDVLVRRREEIKQRIRINDRFISDILARGRVLYAADDL